MGYNPNPERSMTRRQRTIIVAVCWAIAIPIFIVAWELWWGVILVAALLGLWLSWDYIKKGGMADSVENVTKMGKWLVDGLSDDEDR